MDLVETYDDLARNLHWLEHTRAHPSSSDYYKYVEYIRRGQSYLPYVVDEGLAFAPSRLIGYRNNSFSAHASNSDKDGRITTPLITQIIGVDVEENIRLENQYVKFLAGLGGDPSPHKRRRRFWPVQAWY